MKKSVFNAKSFLNAKTLNPLEQNSIRGGIANVVIEEEEEEVLEEVEEVQFEQSGE